MIGRIANLDQAKAIRAKQGEKWARQVAEFQNWRSTPSVDEANLLATTGDCR